MGRAPIFGQVWGTVLGPKTVRWVSTCLADEPKTEDVHEGSVSC